MREGAGWLQKAVGLTDSECDGLDAADVKTPDVDMSRLAVAHHYAIVTHGRVCRAQTAHRHGFQSANATVILHVGPAESPHGIGQILHAKLLNLNG